MRMKSKGVLSIQPVHVWVTRNPGKLRPLLAKKELAWARALGRGIHHPRARGAQSPLPT